MDLLLHIQSIVRLFCFKKSLKKHFFQVLNVIIFINKDDLLYKLFYYNIWNLYYYTLAYGLSLPMNDSGALFYDNGIHCPFIYIIPHFKNESMLLMFDNIWNLLVSKYLFYSVYVCFIIVGRRSWKH